MAAHRLNRAEYVNGTGNHLENRCTIAHVHDDTVRRAAIGPNLGNHPLDSSL